MHGRIETTEAKAKEVQPVVERMVTRAKDGSLAGRRFAISMVGPEMGKRVADDLAPKYAERQGGYTRVVKLTPRTSDAAKMAVIEFV